MSNTPARYRVHLSSIFEVRREQLHDADGNWDAERIAYCLGVELRRLTDVIGTDHEALASVANVVLMVFQTYAEDTVALRHWLREPQAQLGGKTPLEGLLVPGKAAAVEEWVAGVWLGESD